jgi:nucleotide-binding universal stress UspA family protein
MMSGFGVRTLVFPTDFSECSYHAGRTAAAIARHFGARLHVLHVEPPVTAPAQPAQLAAAAADLGGGLEMATATVNGIPARQICAYAMRVGADLIVMGTHGRTGISRALLGSVAEAVVRHAGCPVMTIPAVEPAWVPAVPVAPALEGECVVCGAASPDLICEVCRGIIRGETLERKRPEEHAGHVVTASE